MSEVARVPQLRFPEFSNEWEKNKLGNLAVIKSGISPSKYELKTTGSLPFLKVEDLNNCRKYQFNSRVYSESLKNSINKNSVIFPKRGAAIRLNKVRINKVAALMDSNLMALLPNTELLNTEFLYYKIMLDGLYKIADTSTIPQINNKHILPYKLNLPILPEQQKIAAFLTAVDNKIEQLSKKQELLGEYKKGLMQQIFSQAIRFKADDGSDFPDWEEKKLGDVVSTPVSDGPHLTPKFVKQGVPFLSVNNLVESKIDFSNVRYISIDDHLVFSKKCKPKKGDVLLGKAASVGKVAFVETDVEFNIWSPIAMIRPGNSNFSKYIYYCFQTRFILNQISKFTNSSSQGNIGMGDINKIIIKLPNKLEQTKIANLLSSIDSKIEQVGKQLRESKQFKKALLQQMFV